MKTLIVEDDFTSRLLVQELLGGYGTTHVVTDGKEAVEAVSAAHRSGQPYDLVCMDILLPGTNGDAALQQIRAIEDALPPPVPTCRIVMTTFLTNKDSVLDAFRNQCDAYLVKPIGKAKLVECLTKLGLLEAAAAAS